MNYGVLLSTAALIVAVYLNAPGFAQNPSCPSGGSGTCNCQLNNVEALRTLIRNEVETEVASRLAATPVVGLLYIARLGDNSVVLNNISGVTVRGSGPRRAILENFNSSVSNSSNNLLAYAPNYRDAHRSGIAALMINIVEAFPCINALSGYAPVCKVFTYEDDGFRGGRAIIEASDTGNGFRGIFTGTVKGVFAFGFANCTELNLDCFPRYVEYAVSCYLPRNICG